MMRHRTKLFGAVDDIPALGFTHRHRRREIGSVRPIFRKSGSRQQIIVRSCLENFSDLRKEFAPGRHARNGVMTHRHHHRQRRAA